MFYKISLPVLMDRKPESLLGLESIKDKGAHMMVTGWDNKILSVIMATKQTDNTELMVKNRALSMIRDLLYAKDDSCFTLDAFVIEPIEPSAYLEMILLCGRKYPRFDNGDDPNHTHLLRMDMNEQYDFTSDLIKENTQGNEQSLNLPLDEIPADFDYKSPILLVSSNPLLSHLFARKLRNHYRRATGKTIDGIYVTTISPYDRLLDYVSVFDPETLNKYSNQILMINFNIDQKHPLVVGLFDTYVVPRILDLAKDRLVILVSDNPFVYEHYKYVRMLTLNLNKRISPR